MNILKRLGYVTTTEYLKLKDEKDFLEMELLRLKKEKKKNLEIISADFGDPSPSDTEERKAYVAKVVGFFEDVLRDKIKSMISATHNLLEEEGLDDKQHYKLLGAIYSLRDFLVWGDSMRNEHIAYQTPESDEIVQEEINDLKKLLI